MYVIISTHIDFRYYKILIYALNINYRDQIKSP
jgi:hypothetical protein